MKRSHSRHQQYLVKVKFKEVSLLFILPHMFSMLQIHQNAKFIVPPKNTLVYQTPTQGMPIKGYARESLYNGSIHKTKAAAE
jgi:hypothetical protein